MKPDGKYSLLRFYGKIHIEHFRASCYTYSVDLLTVCTGEEE